MPSVSPPTHSKHTEAAPNTDNNASSDPHAATSNKLQPFSIHKVGWIGPQLSE